MKNLKDKDEYEFQDIIELNDDGKSGAFSINSAIELPDGKFVPTTAEIGFDEREKRFDNGSCK